MKFEWKLKDILMIGIISVLFGVVYLGVTYLGGFVSGLLTPMGLTSLGYEPFYGIYFMAASFAAYVIRKPGAGLIAEILAAIIETLMGNFFGPIIILSGLVQGLGVEVIFAVFRYKKFNLKVMLLASAACSVFTLIYNIFISGYSQIAVPVLLLMLVVRLISAAIFTAIITKFLADRLADAGVLNGYAIGQQVQVDLEA